MVKKLFKYFIRSIAVVFLLLVGNSGMLFLWLVNGPRELPYISNKIEATFAEFSPEFTFKLEKTVVQWDGAARGIGIHLVDATLSNTKGVTVATFPDVEVTLDFLGLLLGNIEFKDMLISQPKFIINAPMNPLPPPEPGVNTQVPVMGPFPISDYRKAIIDILSSIERNNRQVPVQDIKMEDVRLVVDKGAQEIAWEIPSFSVRFIPVGEAVSFQSDTIIRHSGKDMSLQMEGVLEGEQVLHIKSKARNITPAFLTDIFPEAYWFSTVDMMMDSDADILLNPEGRLASIKFTASTIVADDPALKKFTLQASGNVTIHDRVEGRTRVPEIHLKAELENLPVDALPKFWPPEYAKNARDWLVPHIVSGHYDTASVTVNISPEEIISGQLKEESIQAYITFEAVKASYYELFPSLIEGKGSAFIDANSAEITIDHASFNDSYVPGATLKIIDIDKDNVRMDIHGHLVGSMQDLLAFQVMNKDALTSQLQPSGGKAETEFFLNFPLLADLDLPDITIRVLSRLQDISIENVMPGLSLHRGDMNLALEDNALTVHGDAFLDKVQTTITYQEDYNENREFDQQYQVKATLTPQEIPVPEAADLLATYVNGAIDVDITVTEASGTQSIAVMAGLKNAEITLREIGWSKAAGKNGELAVTMEHGDKGYAVKSLVFQAKKASVKGKGNIQLEPLKLDVSLSEVKLPHNDLSMQVEFDDAKKIYRVGINGESVNVGPFINYMLEKEGSKDDSAYASDILINTHNLYLANDVQMTGVSGELHCNKLFCESSRFEGNFKDGAYLTVNYASSPELPEETRRLLVRTDNAGNLLRGLGVLTQIRGGWMEASAISDLKGNGLYEGKMIVKDFKAVKAPLLGKLLTLASLTGFVDILAGEGISFKKLDSQFSYDYLGQININALEASGNSIGITLNGVVNTSADQLKLEGAVIPAYSLNSLLGDIPLIGDTLIGKKGEGIIATRFGVEGNFSDPKISVNPFSLLTPGFLRNIWGSSAAPEKIGVPEAKQKPVLPKN